MSHNNINGTLPIHASGSLTRAMYCRVGGAQANCACAIGPPPHKVHFHPLPYHSVDVLYRIMESLNEDGGRETELERSCTPEDVFSALVDAKLSCSIRVFGSQLGLDSPDLDAIEHNPLDQPPKLLQVLNKCSERAMCGLTWARISDVLKKPALREYRVASQIEQQYLRRNSSVSSLLTLSPLSSSTSSTDCVWPFPTYDHMKVG